MWTPENAASSKVSRRRSRQSHTGDGSRVTAQKQSLFFAEAGSVTWGGSIKALSSAPLTPPRWSPPALNAPMVRTSERTVVNQWAVFDECNRPRRKKERKAVEELYMPIACGHDTLHLGKRRLSLRAEADDHLSNALPRSQRGFDAASRRRCASWQKSTAPDRAAVRAAQTGNRHRLLRAQPGHV